MSDKLITEFLALSCTPDGGVYKYRLYDGGKLESECFITAPSPMFAEISENKLWVLLRAPFADSTDSALAVFDVSSGESVGDMISTGGAVACHLAVDGDDVYCANYVGGSVFRTPNTLVKHEGCGPDKERQLSPHVHGTFFSPDMKYVLACDLGIDCVVVYDRELNEVSRASVPPGSGARHLVFSKDGSLVYCITEMGASISVFTWDDGRLTFVSDVSVTPDGFDGRGKASALKLTSDGRRLYLAERGSCTIAAYEVNGAELRRIDEVSCNGVEPRDICLIADEKYLVCANQFSDTLTLYSVESDGRMTYVNSYGLPTPLCVIEI